MVHTDELKSSGDHPEALLARANHSLAQALRRAPLALARGGARALADPLWLWGVLGGKEVGKSTLINALAGGSVAEPSEEVGEGTFRPTAYLAADDLEPLQARLEAAGGFNVCYHPEAPMAMRGLVLLDLPDFDSLFQHHVEQVRRIAAVLDGVIWVTTPKKIADMRAIQEIRSVLKARTNFIYVVNKVDWLLGQTDQEVGQTLDRLRENLAAQIGSCDEADAEERSFLISARYPRAAELLKAVCRSRDLPESHALSAELEGAARTLEQNFSRLRQTLTQSPSFAEARAGKEANLGFQTRVQARQLLEHFRPRQILERLDRELGDDQLEGLVVRSFPPLYCRHLLQQLNSERELLGPWSTQLIRRRLAYWPLLAALALPVVLLAALVGSLRGLLPGHGSGPQDPFRFDGLALADRVRAVLSGVRRGWSRVTESAEISLVDEQVLQQQFQQDATSAASVYRAACLEEVLERRPTWVGRAIRWVLPVAVLLWFPLVQPLLAGLLSASDGAGGWNPVSLRVVVHTLSPGGVLTGLLVSVLILMLIAAVVCAGALRDAFGALDRLHSAPLEEAGESLRGPLLDPLRRPVEQFRARIQAAGETLERLAGANGSPPGGGLIRLSAFLQKS